MAFFWVTSGCTVILHNIIIAKMGTPTLDQNSCYPMLTGGEADGKVNARLD